ncbi:hypothetical protein [Vibrio campbellii]|uniref:Uncharacterized protein n=1 Tax=Vibrio campbellii (strain ATCC BAA-1116) TaxID=2902295 RepID=A7MRS8_VIBC1|nr:hypothetical protein [Vibrio campbellii]ABU70609.1 hypothetical protein VIBHAR_01640 [Vibrio campbellii ATCC BAA-1116]AGU96358.1 hypothetical protein M892_04925 [Vibrio campbellii ATCC BAA-1116]MBT0122787.1 hypothetical protein [Vibrio campbellii]MBT0137899.1 hypothetical protein [Vibrio campbellii]MBT0142619.1 hypothetical protein [Vibrio campbellii]
MSFSKYLRTKLNDEGINSKSLIAKLQLFSPVFEKLDPVTLSRWLNDRTLPSLEKQLLALQCFESKFYPYLEYINSPSVSRSLTKVYESVFNNIESSYHSILMHRDCDLSIKPSIEEMNWSELKNSVPNFYESISTYKPLFLEAGKYSQSNMTFCSIRSESKVISHLSISNDIEVLSSLFNGRLDIDFRSKSLFFNIGYYACRKHYNMLVGVILNYICDKYESIEDFYVVARGTDFLCLLESFGGELISANRESGVIGNVYLVKLNLIKVLINPFIFSLLIESSEVYQEINEGLL